MFGWIFEKTILIVATPLVWSWYILIVAIDLAMFLTIALSVLSVAPFYYVYEHVFKRKEHNLLPAISGNPKNENE